MTRLAPHLLLLPALNLTACAHASSPDAWNAHRQQVISRCLQASQLNESRPAGQLVEYPDSLGITALPIIGQYPQPHLRGREGRELCLYQKTTGEAFVQELND
jgi:hypothetical protein